jgi:NAD-dependent deacetylase
LADLEQAREWLAQATRVAVLTGAGISAESGVPTFRGNGGLWKEYKAEDLATPEAFFKDPRLVWEWYNWRRELIAKALPNAAHKALVQLEIKKREYTLITQNVDGLHDRAGSGRMLKLHGDIWRMRCTAPTGRTGARRCLRSPRTALAEAWLAPAWSGSASRFPTA